MVKQNNDTNNKNNIERLLKSEENIPIVVLI